MFDRDTDRIMESESEVNYWIQQGAIRGDYSQKVADELMQAYHEGLTAKSEPELPFPTTNGLES